MLTNMGKRKATDDYPVHLYGNDYLLAEWNSSKVMLTQTTQQDGNETASISENVSIGENKIKDDFSWIVDFRNLKRWKATWIYWL